MIPFGAGNRGTLITAAYLKYALAHAAPTRADQLKLIQDLASLPCADVTAERIAAVEPFTHEAARQVEAALGLPPAHSWQKISAGWRVLESEPTWSAMVALNPSLARGRWT